MVTVSPYGDAMPEAPLPAALSPSRLQDFQSCPRKYQHAAIDRIHQPASYATAKGTLVHHVFEGLFARPAPERTPEAARDLVAGAEDAVLTPTVRDEAGIDEDVVTRLRREVDEIITTYFAMEDPRAVSVQGVEMRIRDELDGAPVLGILDRLDRAADGSLVIVDYKTGREPSREYDTQSFANTELYAALCEAHLGERPSSIRLLYVAAGATHERPVTEPAVRARARGAAAAWTKIRAFHARGEFPATPSTRACRFCSFQDLCRADGVAVPPARP
jgi:putative RecB family exonuclease